MRNRIVQLRQKAGLTREMLGDLMNVSVKTVSQWESGRLFPEERQLLRLSDYFRVSPAELFPDGLPSGNTFSEKERRAFWNKKWQREHWAEIIISAAAGMLVWYFINRKNNFSLYPVPMIAVLLFFFWKSRRDKYTEEKIRTEEKRSAFMQQNERKEP